MDLAKYLNRFKTVMGALTGALAVLPLVSEVLPGKAGDYAFPPLGTYQLFWESVSVVISAVIILLIFFIRNFGWLQGTCRNRAWPRSTDLAQWPSIRLVLCTGRINLRLPAECESR